MLPVILYSVSLSQWEITVYSELFTDTEVDYENEHLCSWAFFL